MDYYPKLRIKNNPVYSKYEETKETWNLFTGTRPVKTGRVTKILEYNTLEVSTNVRVKHKGIWYVILVSQKLRSSPEAKIPIEETVNSVIAEAIKVQKHLKFPKVLPEWIEKDKRQFA